MVERQLALRLRGIAADGREPERDGRRRVEPGLGQARLRQFRRALAGDRDRALGELRRGVGAVMQRRRQHEPFGGRLRVAFRLRARLAQQESDPGLVEAGVYPLHEHFEERLAFAGRHIAVVAGLKRPLALDRRKPPPVEFGLFGLQPRNVGVLGGQPLLHAVDAVLRAGGARLVGEHADRNERSQQQHPLDQSPAPGPGGHPAAFLQSDRHACAPAPAYPPRGMFISNPGPF